MKDNMISGLSGQIYNDIKQINFCGSVDIYIPSNNENEQIYCYEIN